ncbi:MAG: hypothetical protein HY908_08465 [Myxococcales bacterium]|nr:hypothetical protein [Myxococcales bacterium]
MGRALRIFSVGLALLLSTFATAACSSPGNAVCDAKCDCEGCSSYGYDNCLNSYEGDLREAEYRGCEYLYDDLVACQEATGYCKSGKFESSCGPERDRLNKCIH